MTSATPQVILYDTTLRDGTQQEGISLTLKDKLDITTKLDELGIHIIEGGWPFSNPKDEEYFRRVRSLPLKTAKIAAFGSTRRAGVTAEADGNLQALVASEATIITLVGKTWDLHVTDVLETSLEENVLMISDSISYLKSLGREAHFDAEHFFDGYAANPDYAMQCLKAAQDAGADVIHLCDTNGGVLPQATRRGGGRAVAGHYSPARHPCPQRRRSGRRQLHHRRSARHRASARDDQRIRRAVRERESVLHHSRSADQDGDSRRVG